MAAVFGMLISGAVLAMIARLVPACRGRMASVVFVPIIIALAEMMLGVHSGADEFFSAGSFARGALSGLGAALVGLIALGRRASAVHPEPERQSPGR